MKVLWTDGSANPNPGPGGWAVLEEVSDGDLRPVALGGNEETTNIRMEGEAMVAAIEYAGEEGCEIHSDSEFWIKTLTEWAPNWAARGWRKPRGEIQNLALVQKLYALYNRYPVRLVWVRGHQGTMANEAADYWANQAREGKRI